jgi:NADH:ubiquinone oxidoreductase subunit 3 (subunit A)
VIWRRSSVRYGALVVALAVGLVLIFPSALAFVELAARELRYLWWLVLMLGVGVWLIWAARRKPL